MLENIKLGVTFKYISALESYICHCSRELNWQEKYVAEKLIFKLRFTVKGK
jgi:hypothetical protein